MHYVGNIITYLRRQLSPASNEKEKGNPIISALYSDQEVFCNTAVCFSEIKVFFWRTHLADEISSPRSRPVRELTPSGTQVDRLRQSGPVHHLLGAFIPKDHMRNRLSP